MTRERPQGTPAALWRQRRPWWRRAPSAEGRCQVDAVWIVQVARPQRVIRQVTAAIKRSAVRLPAA